MVSLYLLIVHFKLGYLGMVFGFSIKFISEIILMLIVLLLYGDSRIFFVPKFKEIFRDFKEIISFSLNYSIGYYTVSMTFEVVSLILIKTENGKTNLLIWVSLAQIINAVYYIGYGIGSYGRALGNHFIGVNDKGRFKVALYKCVKFHSIITYLINIPFFIFAYQIGEMFIDEEEHIKTFANYLRLLSFFLPLDSMMPLLNSFMRLLSHNFYTMCLMIFGFAFVITGTSLVLCFYFGSGAFGPVMGLILCNIIIVSFSLLRIYYNLDYYLDSVIQHAIEMDKKNQDQDEAIEKEGVGCGKDLENAMRDDLVNTDVESCGSEK